MGCHRQNGPAVCVCAAPFTLQFVSQSRPRGHLVGTEDVVSFVLTPPVWRFHVDSEKEAIICRSCA